MTKNSDRGERILWVLLGVLPAMVLCSLWIHANHYYPRYDASDFVATSQKIYLTARADVWEAFKLVFWHKEYKPIIHPVLLALAMMLVGGKIFIAILFSNLAYIFFFGYFLFKILRLWLDEKKSAIGVFFITTIPWYLWNAHTAFSELFFLVLCAITANCAIASKWGREKRTTGLGLLWLTIMYCARPVESALLTLVPFAVFLFVGARKRQWSRELIVRFSIYLGGALSWFGILWGCGKNLEYLNLNLLFYLYPCLPLAAHYALNRRQKKRGSQNRNDEKSNEKFLVAVYLILVVWFSPAMGGLKAWVIESNFQQSFNASSRRPGMSIFGYVWFYLKTLGGLPLFFFGFFAIPGVAALLNRSKSERLETAAIASSLIWVAFGPVLVSSVSLNDELRYYQASILMLLVFFFIVFAQRAVRLSSPAIISVLVLAVANVFHVTEPIFKPEREQTFFALRNALGFYNKELFPFREKDPMQTLTEWLESKLGNRKSPLVYWRLLAGGYDWDFGFGPFKLLTLERQSSFEIKKDSPNYDDNWRAQLLGFQEHFKLHLLGPIGDTNSRQRDATAVNYFAEKILEHWKAGRLGELGMHALGEIDLSIRDGKTFKYVLIESDR